jgi:hypothetical protein
MTTSSSRAARVSRLHPRPLLLSSNRRHHPRGFRPHHLSRHSHLPLRQLLARSLLKPLRSDSPCSFRVRSLRRAATSGVQRVHRRERHRRRSSRRPRRRARPWKRRLHHRVPQSRSQHHLHLVSQQLNHRRHHHERQSQRRSIANCPGPPSPNLRSFRRPRRHRLPSTHHRQHRRPQQLHPRHRQPRQRPQHRA